MLIKIGDAYFNLLILRVDFILIANLCLQFKVLKKEASDAQS